MVKKLLLFFILCFLSIKTLKAQVKLSVYSEISLVTAGPGEELYEKFGHSAVRIKDPLLNLDVIYNYGIFDFNQPDFYTNFAQGKMYYMLARYDFKYFLASYKNDKRWLKQQVLNLTTQEKQQFFLFLENNALPKNATYLYDPFFDNCATILRDITKNILKENVTFTFKEIEKNKSLRELMDKEIYWNSWGNLGINLIAGTILDTKRDPIAYTYLPDYLYKVFQTGQITRENKKIDLVKREDVLLDFKEKQNLFSFFNPLYIFILLFILISFITYKDIKLKKRNKKLDFILFFISGFVGLILLYLWLFSSHKTAPNNFTILWAFAPNLVISFLLLKTGIKNWIQKYVLVLLLFILIIAVLWSFKIQVFPLVLIPVFGMYFIRYIYLYKFLLTSKK